MWKYDYNDDYFLDISKPQQSIGVLSNICNLESVVEATVAFTIVMPLRKYKDDNEISQDSKVLVVYLFFKLKA